MDEEIRGIIEKSIDNLMERDVIPDIEWVRDVTPLGSFEDVIFGYAIGVLKQCIFTMLVFYSGGKAISEEDSKEVNKILERRIPEIRQKIISELTR